MRAPAFNPPPETHTKVGSSYTPRSPGERLYAPLPKGMNAKGIGKNTVFFTTFDYGKAPLYNGSLPGTNKVAADGTHMFYAKIAGHYMEVPGERFNKRIFVVCRKVMNAYVTGTLGLPPLFKDSTCPCCDLAREAWALYDDAWQHAVGLDGKHPGDRKALKFDDIKIINKINPALGVIAKRIEDVRVVERYQFVVYDIDKLQGVRDLDDGEAGPVYQIYIGPKGIYDALYDAQPSGFYDPSKGRTFILTKDASKGNQYASYKMTLADAMVLPPDVIAYLDDESNIPHLKTVPWGGEGDYILPPEDLSVMQETLQIAYPPLDLASLATRKAADSVEAPPAAPAPAAPPAPAPPAPAGKRAPVSPGAPATKPGRW
jgi:hypothetical protein